MALPFRATAQDNTDLVDEASVGERSSLVVSTPTQHDEVGLVLVYGNIEDREAVELVGRAYQEAYSLSVSVVREADALAAPRALAVLSIRRSGEQTIVGWDESGAAKEQLLDIPFDTKPENLRALVLALDTLRQHLVEAFEAERQRADAEEAERVARAATERQQAEGQRLRREQASALAARARAEQTILSPIDPSVSVGLDGALPISSAIRLALGADVGFFSFEAGADVDATFRDYSFDGTRLRAHDVRLTALLGATRIWSARWQSRVLLGPLARVTTLYVDGGSRASAFAVGARALVTTDLKILPWLALEAHLGLDFGLPNLTIELDPVALSERSELRGFGGLGLRLLLLRT